MDLFYNHIHIIRTTQVVIYAGYIKRILVTIVAGLDCWLRWNR